jgi:hypothetical protein
MTEEEVTISDKSSLHNYRTELPHIIYYLHLSKAEFQYYSYLKKVAGDGGNCTKSQANISKVIDCSTRHIRRMNDSLSKVRSDLGISLISITKRVGSNNQKQTSLIEINDIWPINFMIVASVKMDFDREKKKGNTLDWDDLLFKKVLEWDIMSKGRDTMSDKEEPLKKLKRTTTPKDPEPKKPRKPRKKKSSSFAFCPEKDKIIQQLPLSDATKKSLMRFTLEVITYAHKLPVPTIRTTFANYFFSLCKRLESGEQSMDDTPYDPETAKIAMKEAVQKLFKGVVLPPNHEINHLEGGYQVLKDGRIAEVVGYGELDCMKKTESIINYLKASNGK